MIGIRVVTICVLGCVGLAGCNTQAPSSDGSDGSESGTANTGDSTSGEESGSGSAETGGSDESSSSSTGSPPLVTISGEVLDLVLLGTIPLALISFLDEPGHETVSDGDGQWTLTDLEPGLDHTILIADNATYWGAVHPFTTPDQDVNDFRLTQISFDFTELQEGILQETEPTVVLDSSAAIIIALVNQPQATGTVITLDPPPLTNTYYAPDPDGSPVLNSSEAQWPLLPVVVFFNIAPGDSGTYTLSAVHPTRDCTVAFPEPLTLSRYISLVEIDCPAP